MKLFQAPADHFGAALLRTDGGARISRSPRNLSKIEIVSKTELISSLLWGDLGQISLSSKLPGYCALEAHPDGSCRGSDGLRVLRMPIRGQAKACIKFKTARASFPWCARGAQAATRKRRLGGLALPRKGSPGGLWYEPLRYRSFTRNPLPGRAHAHAPSCRGSDGRRVWHVDEGAKLLAASP